jgi:hypothetical protein
MAAAVWGIEHFHVYLIGKQFTLVTDHQPLGACPVFGASSEQHLPKLAAQLFEKNTRFEEDTRTKYNFWWPLT